MEQWLRQLIESAVTGLRGLIDAVWERLTWVYNVFVEVARGIRDAWDRALARIRHYVSSVNSLAFQSYMTIWWIVFVRIPQLIGQAVSDITHWAVQEIQGAYTFIQGIAASIIQWATNHLNALRAFIDNLLQWATTKFNEIIDYARRMGELVFTLLTSPARMAQWLVSSMITATIRYLDENADRLFTLVRQRAVLYTLRFADKLEDMLERLI